MNDTATETDAAAAGEQTLTRVQVCLATLNGGYSALRFPPALEDAYRSFHATRALEVIQTMLPWLTLLYLAAVLVMYNGASAAGFNAWLGNGLYPVLIGIAWLWVARWSGLLARHPHLHTGLVLAVALLATTRTIFILGNETGVIYVTYQVIYLLFVAFTIAQLRLQQSVILTIAVCPLLAGDALLEGLTTDWLAFGQYFLTTALLAAVIGYLIEHRARGEWLRSEIAQSEQEEMAALRIAAESEAARQRVLGDYLERVAGNLTPTEIAGRTLTFLTQQTVAQIGTVFLVEGKRLRRACSHALEGETTSDMVDRGESLIGQAAVDGRRQRLMHLSDDYHPIRTATGSASPTELIVQPVQQQGSSLAVIELGSLSLFGDGDIALLDRVCQAMAATLVAANAREALARAGMDDFTL